MDQRQETDVFRGNARLPTEAVTHGPIIRLFTDWRFAMRAARYVLGLPVPLQTEDRRVLERVIFPHFLSRAEVVKVLFVGCDWYTKHYQRVFFRTHDFWTLDCNPAARKFAGTQHVVAGLERLDEFFPEDCFDLVICNGVYGFGLDTTAQCERAFDLCYSRLAHDRYFVFGWTDIPARTPLPVDGIASLKRFRKYPFPAFDGAWRYVTDTPYRQTYDFYRK